MHGAYSINNLFTNVFVHNIGSDISHAAYIFIPIEQMLNLKFQV